MSGICLRCAVLIVVCLAAVGCGPPESAKQEAELVTVSVNIKPSKGRAPELEAIAFYNPAGEGVASGLPSGGALSTRLVPGTYKVTALPSMSNPNAAKAVTEKYQNPAETPWEITVTPAGGDFELTIE